MAEEKSAILPRKVTEEDKEAAGEELVPHLKNVNQHQAAKLKRLFGELRGLTPIQVEAIIFEVKRRASLRASSEE